MPEMNGKVLAHVRVVSASAGSTPAFDLHRFPAYIGMDAGCDVRLDGGAKDAIAGRHAQLLSLHNGQFLLVNLSSKPILVQAPNAPAIESRKSAGLPSRSRIVIGTYTLELLAASDVSASAWQDAPALDDVPRTRKSGPIGLRLDVQDTYALAAGGRVLISTFIKNNDAAERVAFDVKVVGVAAMFCEADDGPTLNPGEERGVVVAIKQPAGLKDEKLPAGDLLVGVHVRAAAYAGQPAEETVTLRVLPVYLPKLEDV
jgi:hypothetical protein